MFAPSNEGFTCAGCMMCNSYLHHRAVGLELIPPHYFENTSDTSDTTHCHASENIMASVRFCNKAEQHKQFFRPDSSKLSKNASKTIEKTNVPCSF